MSDFNTSKVDGNTVGASEWNQLADVDNLVINSGQTPSSSNLDQLAIASARYSSGGQFFTDSGTANAYVLSPVSPFKSPVSSGAGEGYFTGMIIRFRAGNANSGASTVNVNGAGVKNLLKEDGSALTAGDITTNNDVSFRYDGTAFVRFLGNATTSTKGVSLLPQQITIANNSTDTEHDIDFSVGNAQADDGSLVWPATAMTKRIDATWVAGNNQGGLDTGTVANNTPYYCFAIYNPTTLASDFLFSASKSSPTLPSGYTKKYYLGGLRTDGSANIRPGNYKYGRNCYEFLYKDSILDVSTATIPTTRTVLTTTVLPLSKVNFIATYVDDDVSDNSIVFTEEGQSDEVPGDDDDLFSDQNYASKTNRSMWTNSSSQIYWRGGDAAAVLFRFKTLGWFEYL